MPGSKLYHIILYMNISNELSTLVSDSTKCQQM